MAYIYILTNKSMTGLLKVGVTTRTPTERAKELQTTGVPTPYEIAAYWTIDGSQLLQIESEIHNLFDNFRISKDREFFRLPLNTAKAKISDFLKTYEEIEQNRRLAAEAILEAEKERQDQERRQAEAEAAWIEIKDSMWEQAHAKAEQVCGMTNEECLKIINSKMAKITDSFDLILWATLSIGTFFILPFILFLISEYFDVDFSIISLKPKKVKKAETAFQKLSVVTENNFKKFHREHFKKYDALNMYDNPKLWNEKFSVL